jgi:hypothetical protein
MQAEKSKKLILELKQSKWLPPYNNELIRNIVQEVDNLYGKITESLAHARSDPSAGCSLIIMHSSISRIKRSVLAYLNFRLTKLEKLRWETGPAIPQHFETQLSDDEKLYFRQYS